MIKMFICSYHLLNKHINNIYTIVTEFDIKDWKKTLSLTCQITKRGLMPLFTEALINNRKEEK